MEFAIGNRVNMYINGRLVAIGSVCETNPKSHCSTVAIGEGNVSILVEICVQKDAILPFPTMDATRVWEAFHSIIKWSIDSLQHVSRMPEGEDHAQRQNVSNEMLLMPHNWFSYREAWKGKKVQLWNEEMSRSIGEGLVMYVYPHDSVNFGVLGDDNIGIGIEGELEGELESSLHDIGTIGLLKWPIKRVTMLDGRTLLQYEDLLNENDVSNMHLDHVSLVEPLSRKRKYCFHKRKPKTNIVLAKKFKMVSSEVIQMISTIDCCKNGCCQHAIRESVLALRKEFWNQSLQKRTDYVYDTLSVACRKNPSGKMDYEFSLNGIEICCRAWYEMHGISKTSFYRYKENFENGVRRCMHGNMGLIRKGRDHTEMGRAIIQRFVENCSERMPHKSRTMQDGTRETLLVIPDMYKQVDILHEVNVSLKELNYQQMSSSTFNRIWNTDFKHVTLSKTSEFSKCSTCSRIKAQLGSTKDQEERENLMEERRFHMLQQQSCRNVYYTWRTYSQMQPQKYLCIIHDKMDQKKTAIPRLRVKSKEYDSAYQLQVSLTGMITHGHGQGHYGHFSLNGLWPSDPNFTIGSLALCFQNLERIEKHGLGDLCNDSMPQCNTTLFQALNSRKALDHHYKMRGKGSLITSTDLHAVVGSEESLEPQTLSSTHLTSQLQLASFRKLPENLLLQLDNCAAENKNRYLFAYLSLLVAKGVFKTVTLGFLMVGHTHEDIDAMFSKLSESLRTGMTFTFPHLMDTFRQCSSASPAPFLLTKVPDFKSFVDGFLCSGQDTLVGHSKPLQFCFFMQGEIPTMQYKIHPKLPDWLPKEGGIELWKKDNEGRPMLPVGCPNMLPIADYVKDNLSVVNGIRDYLSFWEKWSEKNGKEATCTQFIEPVIDYWKDMIIELQRPTNKCVGNYGGFWPKTEGTHHMQHIEDEADAFQGYEEWNDHYCGPSKQRPKDVFKPHIDVKKGDFVLVRPGDPEYPIWLGVAESDVDMDRSSSNYKRILIQYWAPKHRRKNPTTAELYDGCWEKNWCCNLADPKRWEFVDTVVWSWIPRGNKMPDKIKIPPNIVEKAQASLLACVEN